MTKLSIQSEILTDIADAIRSKNGETDLYYPQNMASKIGALNVENIQVDEMPEANASSLGNIVQYVGESTLTYTKGYFYICVSSGGGSPVYSWSRIDVQPEYIDNVHYIESNTSDNPFVFANNDPGIYIFPMTNSVWYVKGNDSDSVRTTTQSFSGCILDYHTKLTNDLADSTEIARCNPTVTVTLTKVQRGVKTFSKNSQSEYGVDEGTSGSSLVDVVNLSTDQSIGGTKTFTNSPRCSATPSSVNDLTNKSYVDPTVVTDANTTYTISNLQENNIYKLGELTSLTISAISTINKESDIFFMSDSTSGCDISLPSSITNLGDVPTLTEVGGVNSGTCDTDKNYIISILNNIAIWKKY